MLMYVKGCDLCTFSLIYSLLHYWTETARRSNTTLKLLLNGSLGALHHIKASKRGDNRTLLYHVGLHLTVWVKLVHIVCTVNAIVRLLTDFAVDRPVKGMYL